MALKAAPCPSYQSVEVEAEPSTIDRPPIAAPGRCFWNTVESLGQLPTVSPDFLFAASTYRQKPRGNFLFVSPTKTTSKTGRSPSQSKPQPLLERMVCRCQGDLSQFLKTCHKGLEEIFFGCRLWDWRWIFCLTNWFQVTTWPFQHIFFCMDEKNLFGEMIKMDGAEWSALSRDDLLLGFFHDNGPTQNFRKIGLAHPSIQRFIAPTAAPTRRKRSGVICCKSLRGSYGFIKIGDSEASSFVGGHL